MIVPASHKLLKKVAQQVDFLGERKILGLEADIIKTFNLFVSFLQVGPRKSRASLVHGHLGQYYSLDDGRQNRSNLQSKFHHKS